MDSVIFHKKVYWKIDEDCLYITVTKENNGYFIWYESDGNNLSNSIIDYHSWDKDLMIEKAVDVSRLPLDKIKELILKPKVNFIFNKNNMEQFKV